MKDINEKIKKAKGYYIDINRWLQTITMRFSIFAESFIL